MNESWINKNENEIRNDIVAIAKEETGLTNFKSIGVLRGFIETIARVVLFIYQTAINPIFNNAALDEATGFFLSLWGLMLGVVRKQSGKTTGVFTGTAYGDGSISAGTWAVVEGTELRFKVSENVNFHADTKFAIPVIAEHPGLAYNIGGGIPLRLTRVVNGLEAVSVGEDWVTSPGQDVEEDDPYRVRIKSRWKGQVLGDTKEVYRFYAEEVDGVRAACIVRTPRGPGTTDVIIAAVNGQPSLELLQAVKDNLYAHELMAFDIQVKAPNILTIELQIEYTGDASTGEIIIIAERYVYDLGIGGRFKVSDLYELYRPLNLKTVEIISPDRDVQPEADTIIEATITANKAA
jgi:uncharacterized phage protein gp47/JayE